MPAVIFPEGDGREFVAVVRGPIPDALVPEISALGGRVVPEAPPPAPGQARADYDAAQLARHVRAARELGAIARMTDETDDRAWDEEGNLRGLMVP